MGQALCFEDRSSQEAFNSAVYFWNDPSLKKLGKRQSSTKQYDIGIMYRGKRSILTEEELCAAKMILRAYRNYRQRTILSQSTMSSSYEMYSRELSKA